MIERLLLLGQLVVFVVASGCGGDAAVPTDAGLGVMDGRVALDGAVPADAGELPDVASIDAPAPFDAGPPDAGAPPDGGPSRCADLALVFSCNGVTRTVMGRDYCVKVPSSYRAGTPMPVVLMLHGFGADGESQSNYLDLNDTAETRGFILVKPNGTLNSTAQRYWNAFPACCVVFATDPPDDVAFLDAVLDDVESAYTVDTHREYAMGHSNGAFMTNRLACDRTTRFAAIATLAGTLEPSLCTPSAPISVLHIHASDDLVINYPGGMVIGAPDPYVGAEADVAFWASANGCGAARTEVETREMACGIGDAETHVERYSGCSDGTVVELWRMDIGGHVPLFRVPDWPSRVVDFFYAHAR